MKLKCILIKKNCIFALIYVVECYGDVKSPIFIRRIEELISASGYSKFVVEKILTRAIMNR